MKKFLITLLVLAVVVGLCFGLYYFLWTPENLSSLGDRYMKAEKYERAAFFYERAARLDPDNTTYTIELADAWLNAQNYTQAERTLVTALEKKPDATLCCKLSAVYVAQGKFLDAQQMLDSVTDPETRAALEALRPQAPVLSPAGGEFSEYIDLTMEGDGRIYYSVNDEYPGTEGNVYSEPLHLSGGSTHMRAILVDEHGLVSPLAEADYMIVGVVEPVTFESAELERFVRDQLYIARTEQVMTDDLWQITELTVPEDVTVYSDLRWFTELKSLTLQNRTELSGDFLPALKKLETLDLSGCLVSAELMEQIGGLTALQTLNLNECGLSNISALGNLTELTSLDLSDNSISDLSALRGCQKLSVLLVASNALVDLNALSGMTTLTELDISGNRVTSLEPLAACTGMLTLRANSNGLSAIGVLQNMPELQIFQASNNSISDVSPLNSCTQLVRLNLKNNQVTTADFLSLMPLLTHVDISHNSISALPQLPENAALQKLYASYNQLTDLTVLSNLASLNYVDVDYNPELTDLGCLASCYMLVQVNAFGTKVTDVSALTAMNVIVNYDPTSVSAG